MTFVLFKLALALVNLAFTVWLVKDYVRVVKELDALKREQKQ